MGMAGGKTTKGAGRASSPLFNWPTLADSVPHAHEPMAAADLVLWERLPRDTVAVLRAAGEVVFCDGACPNNGFGARTAGVGVFWGTEDDPRNVSRPVRGDVITNNVAELQALTAALQGALKPPARTTPLAVVTDSMYALQCLSQWAPGWQRRGWVKADGEPVKNRAEVEAGKAALDAAASVRRVHIVHIAAHCGHPGNEAADRLAVAGAAAMEAAASGAGAGARQPRRRKRSRAPPPPPQPSTPPSFA